MILPPIWNSSYISSIFTVSCSLDSEVSMLRFGEQMMIRNGARGFKCDLGQCLTAVVQWPRQAEALLLLSVTYRCSNSGIPNLARYFIWKNTGSRKCTLYTCHAAHNTRCNDLSSVEKASNNFWMIRWSARIFLGNWFACVPSVCIASHRIN